jgi:hypothetical protein
MNFVFALMPLAIGIYSFALLRGWILVRPQDPEFSKQWIEQNRMVFRACAVLSTTAGVCCLIYAFGLLPDLSRH